MMNMRAWGLATTFLLAAAPLSPVGAQAADTSRRTIDLSGVLFANFRYRTDSATKAANGGKPASRFDVERVYLTLRMPAGDRASVRVTTDIFTGDQSSSSFYRGWAMRLKYAYLQLDLSRNLFGIDGLGAVSRIGMLHTVAIEHEESFWPRYIASTGIDRNGFFSSSDVGASLLLTLPARMGEVYATITNGPGYTSAENDRFKDYAMRVTLTPLARNESLGAIARSVTLTGWAYAGQTASRFREGGAGQVGPVSDGLSRDRVGMFVGVRDPRVTAGLSLARRTETTESGQNTVTNPRQTVDVSGQITSVFAVVRPGAWRASSATSRWGIVGRFDSFTPDVDVDPEAHFTVASLFWEANSRVTFSLDHQAESRRGGPLARETRAFFARVQALF